jgi:hypothetical protein
MMRKDMGVAASPPLSHPSGAEPVPVSGKAGIANAGMQPNVTYLSCPLCHGSRETSFGKCISCADPDPTRVRWMLERLTAEQIDFIRAYGHTLAKQPVTEAEYDAHSCEFYVEDWDGEYDEDEDIWLIPNTRYWFAGGQHRMGPCGNASFINYNPTGLLLRECLMCGADSALPSMYPPRHAPQGGPDAS